jgi:polysaccharide pyruvyl transferase WcaK-like protein
MTWFEREKTNGDEIDFPLNGMSIDLLRAVYRSPAQPLGVRLRAAIAAMPHEVPKLAVNYEASTEDFAALLDKRIEHQRAIEEGKIIEHTPQAVEAKPFIPRVADRRWRRL